MTLESSFSGQVGGSFGLRGSTHRSSAGTLPGNDYFAIQALADSSVTWTGVNWDGDATTSVSLLAGTIIYGQFNSVTLVSGRIIAYKA